MRSMSSRYPDRVSGEIDTWSPSSARCRRSSTPLLLAAVLADSVLLGLAAGAYPAWQAAHVEVLEVLRNE